MAKVGLTKLGLKVNTNVIPLTWNNEVIEIKEYLPIEKKLEMITRIVAQSLDDNNFANPARLKIFTCLEVMYAYTNINFTDKQKEDILGLYDLLNSSGLWKQVKNILEDTKPNEWDIIVQTTKEVVNEIYRYRDSALGIIQAVAEDYKNLDLDATKIQEKIANKENLELLDTVMNKLG